MAALVAPRPLCVMQPSQRARKELAPLSKLYQVLGKPDSLFQIGE